MSVRSAILAALVLVAVSLHFPQHSSAQDLKIHVINVNLGNATFIEFPDGTTWLIDQGISGDYVHDYIDGLGYSSIDYVIATHFDRDHYGGIDEVLSGTPALPYNTAAYEHEGPKIEGDDSYTAIWDSETTSPLRSSPSPGQTWSFGGVTVESVCVGTVNGDEVSGYNTLVDTTQVFLGAQENSYSLGFRISWNGFDYLTCGDLTSNVEDVLAPKISSDNFDVVHVNHHGSSSSTSLYWCETLEPETAVISVGTSNSYGHPTQDTLDNLNGIGSSWGGVDWIYATEQGSGGGGSASNFSYLNDDIVITYNSASNQYTIAGGATSDVYAADEGATGPTSTPTNTPTGSTPTPTRTSTPTITPTPGAYDIVVNQVGPYSVGGGGVGEYVELYNKAVSAVSLNGWELNVYSGDYTFTASDVIPAQGFYLIADTSPCDGLTPDVYTTINITDNGVNSYAQLINDSAVVVDTVGWSGSALFEGTKLGTLGTGKAWTRTTDGADTDNNISDFSQIVCNPRNSSSGPPTATPTITSTPSATGTATITPTITPTPSPLPYQVFFDDFPTGSIDTGKWTYNTGTAESNTTGIAEPSGTFSLNLDGHSSGGDEIRTQVLDLSSYAEATVSYYWERRGNGNSPETSEDLWVDYWNGSDWVNLAQYLGGGDDMSTYQYEYIALPAGALHSSFQLRFRNEGTQNASASFDDWLVDDVEIRASAGTPTPTNTPTSTPTATPTVTPTATVTQTPTPWPFPWKVNFQPAAVPTVPGHVVDAAAAYGTNGNYGWR